MAPHTLAMPERYRIRDGLSCGSTGLYNRETYGDSFGGKL
jgi:hypothetical protein